MADEKTYSQMRREFYEAYRTKIVPAVKGFEDERKRTRIIATIVSTLFAIACLFFVVLGYTIDGSSKDKEEIVKLAFFLGFLSWGSWYSFKKNFENKIKKRIMPTVCSCFGDFRWSEGSYSREYAFKDSLVVPNFTSSDYDDVFRGSYKNVQIDIVEAEYIRKSGKYSSTVFDGVIIKLDMNKKFNSHTVIQADTLLHISPSGRLQHTVLEDPEFEKKYDVFTNDPVDARYLITPSFMERLKNMKTAFSADKVSCAFYGKNLFVALSTSKDLFSICSLVKSVDDAKQYFTMYEEIVSIIKLIDHFKLDQKLGL